MTNVRLLVGYLTRHFRFSYHLWRIGQVVSPVCQLCLQQYTTCVSFLRLKLFKGLFFNSEILDVKDVMVSSLF